MTRALFWKEFREQRAIWLTLVLVAGTLPPAWVALHSNAAGPRWSLAGTGFSVSMSLCLAYGLICGALLFAGEREGQTQSFLDAFPGGRWPLWRAKVGAGLSLVMTQVLVQTGLLLIFGYYTHEQLASRPILLLAGWSLFQFAWGLSFSASSASVLGAIGKGLTAQVGGFLALYAVSLCVVSLVGVLKEQALGAVPDLLIDVLIVPTIAVPAVSALVFTRPDRLRRTSARPAGTLPRFVSELRVLLWLERRQVQGLAKGLGVWGLVTGLLAAQAGLFVWPVATSVTGIVCGLMVCRDEQRSQAYRFLGEQRYPLGRIWLVKLGVHMALALGTTLLQIMPGLVAAFFRGGETRRVGELNLFFRVFNDPFVEGFFNSVWFLIVWPIYGFCVGQLCGLLFRKLLTATVMALAGSLVLLGLWVPSLVGGGLHAWRVMGVPLLFLGAALVELYPWASERLASRGPLLRLTLAIVLAASWLALALGYRVWEVPDVPARFDLDAFANGFPSGEKDRAGRAILAAEREIVQLYRDYHKVRPDKGTGAKVSSLEESSFDWQTRQALRNGWSARYQALGTWLNELFSEKWLQQLSEIVNEPLGGINNPSLRKYTLLFHSQVSNADTLARLLAVRGLQRQAAGDDEAFVRNLAVGLALTRNLRYRAISFDESYAVHVETILLRGLDRWLEAFNGKREVLGRVLALLRQHEAEMPVREQEGLGTEYLIARNTVALPREHIKDYLRELYGLSGLNAVSVGDWESHFVADCWQMPWERLRQERILRAQYEGSETEADIAGKLAPAAFNRLYWLLVQSRRNTPQRRAWRFSVAQVRAAQLKVALRMYQADTGKPAGSLEVLLPGYLPAVPLDPFDDKPFRYRLSSGESVFLDAIYDGPTVRPDTTTFVPAGQGILWSVGPDGKDNGGHNGGVAMPISNDPVLKTSDLIYLVPLRGKAK